MKTRNLIAGAALALSLSAAPALAQTAETGGTDVGGETTVRGDDLSRTPRAEGTGGTRGALPVTGGDILGLAAIGAAAVGTGSVIVRRSRKQSV